MADPISKALHAISGMARKARLRDRLPEEHSRELHLLLVHPDHQGYDDREDESLGMRTGRESDHTQDYKARREDSYGKWGTRDERHHGHEGHHRHEEHHRDHQGYDDREDESLGMRRGRESDHEQDYRARREDSYGKWGDREEEHPGQRIDEDED